MIYPNLTFTMTTFNRLPLFIETMNSFLETCLDKFLIKEWIISDDGSSDEDLQAMQSLYPFLTVLRSPRKGQAANLNYLFSKVTTEWFFHCEDDWRFIKKGHYLERLFDVAFDSSENKNVVLRHWEGGELKKTKSGIDYNVHVHDPDVPRQVHTKNDAWWCGYSLNPGLQHLPTIRLLGKYDESTDISKRTWDRPQAQMYFALGLKRANLLGHYIEHIGEGKSAYKFRGSSF